MGTWLHSTVGSKPLLLGKMRQKQTSKQNNPTTTKNKPSQAMGVQGGEVKACTPVSPGSPEPGGVLVPSSFKVILPPGAPDPRIQVATAPHCS